MLELIVHHARTRGERTTHRALTVDLTAAQSAALDGLLGSSGGPTRMAWPDFVRRTVYLVSFGVIGAFLIMGAAVMMSAPSQALARRRVDEISAAAGETSAVD